MFYRRPLIPCILAYVAGLWLVHWVYHFWPAAALLLGGLTAAASISVAVRSKDMSLFYLFLLMALGASVMGVRERRAYVAQEVVTQLQSPAAKIISGKVKAMAELTDTESSRLILSDVRVTSGSGSVELPGLVYLTLDAAGMAGGKFPGAGQRVIFPGRIFKPGALHNFFGYDRTAALRHEGVFAGAAPLGSKGIVRIQSGSDGVFGRISRTLSNFRRLVSENLLRDMWDREGRLMVAMLFNDMRNLGDDEKAIFRDSQTFHLFAVSGMHVAILAFVLNLLFRALRFGVRASWLGVAVVLLIYLWIIGFVPSATRSYLMLVAFTAAYVLGREVDALTSLFFAIAAVVAFDPAAPWKAGFVLSVAGVTGIILLAPLLLLWFPWPGENRHSGWRRWAANGMKLLMATIAVSIFLLPLQVYYFGFWNAVSPVANLLQAILAEFVLSAGILTAVAGLVSEEAGALAGQSASAIMWMIYGISKAAAELPEGMFYFRQIPLWLLMACYGILIGGYYLVHRDSPEFRLKSRARFATHACCCLGMLIVFQHWSDSRQDELEIWSLDVGQGDATLVRFSNGETLLIDGGRSDPDMGRLVVVPQLRGLGISRLDYIVATHDDDDHTGGLAEVIRSVGCKNLLVPAGLEAKSKSTKAMLKAAKDRNCVVQTVSSGYTARAGEALIEILNPLKGAANTGNDNENSVVLQVSLGQFSALLMGDAGLAVEERLIRERKLSPVTLLKAGHHGSKTATGKDLLVAVRPKCVLISCGAGNRFGHPATDVMARLALAGGEIFRTDVDGAICVSTNGDGVNVKRAVGW